MATTIITKFGSGAPTASDVVRGELAVDTENKRLYTEDSGGSVVELGTNPAANVTFGDNVKAIFGAGSDLQIYHDGSNSFVEDTGDGALFLKTNGTGVFLYSGSEALATFNTNGASNLYYDNALKLSTTSAGIDVTGTATAASFETDAGGTFTTASGNDLNIVYPTSRSLFIKEGSDTHVTVDNAGNVGIGTSSPATPLDVTTAGGSDFVATFQNTTSATPYGVWVKEPASAANGYPSLQVTDSTGTTARLRVDSGTGNVGIGTSSPTFGLSVESDNGSGYAALFRKSSSDPALTIQTTSSITQIQGLNSALSATNDIAMQLSGGNVGIGTSSPSSALHISGDYASNKSDIQITNTNGGRSWRIGDGIGALTSKLVFWDGTAGASRMIIDSSGNVGIGTSPASELHVKGSTPDLRVENTTASETVSLSLIKTATKGFSINNKEISGTNYLTFNLDTAGAGTDAMVIHPTSGNVGIGGAPSSTLDVGCGVIADPTLRIDSAAGGDPVLLFDTGAASRSSFVDFRDQGTLAGSIIYSHADDHLGFSVASNNRSEVARFDSSGNLLVGRTTSTVSTFEIEGSGGSSTGAKFGFLSLGNSGTGYPFVGYNCAPTTTPLTYNRYATDYASWVDFTSGQVRTFTTTATATGNTTGTAGPYVARGGTSWTSSSDRRLKDDIQEISYGIDAVKSLAPVSYIRNDRDVEGRELGFIAQDVEGVVDEVVDVTDDGYYGIDYQRLVPVLTKAIQEQQDLIESLTARIAALEGAN